MPTLHELFDAATDGMPPLPDLAPAARRIVRRRQFATRTAAAVLASALVIGAGTFALSVHQGNASDAADNPPQAFSLQYELETLQSIWPNKDQQLSLNPAGGIDIAQHGQVISRMYLSVAADIPKFQEQLRCAQTALDCLQATTGDGDKVLAKHGDFPATKMELPGGGLLDAYRLHGTDLSQLGFANLDGSDLPLTDQQLLGIVESPAYEQLVESAIAASSLPRFGTPPTSTPGEAMTYVNPGPAPSHSAN
jgi:hypothetical protein